MGVFIQSLFWLEHVVHLHLITDKYVNITILLIVWGLFL